jgi:hypothetical protein
MMFPGGHQSGASVRTGGHRPGRTRVAPEPRRGDIRERTIDGRRPPPVAGRSTTNSMVLTAVSFSLPSIVIVCAASAAAASATFNSMLTISGAACILLARAFQLRPRANIALGKQERSSLHGSTAPRGRRRPCRYDHRRAFFSGTPGRPAKACPSVLWPQERSDGTDQSIPRFADVEPTRETLQMGCPAQPNPRAGMEMAAPIELETSDAELLSRVERVRALTTRGPSWVWIERIGRSVLCTSLPGPRGTGKRRRWHRSGAST